MSFKNVKPQYSKWHILAEKNGCILAKDADAKDFYAFGTEQNFDLSSFPVNQCGTLAEVLAELERWKNEVDFDNVFMSEIEADFINALKVAS